MDELTFFLMLLLIPLLIIGVPILISVIIYKLIKKRKNDKRFRIIALSPILIVAYLLYAAIYPSEDFYRDDFKEVAGTELPQNVEIEYKSASFPDHFGDYTSVSVIKVGEEFYRTLPKQLIEHGLSENNKIIHTKEFDKALAYLEDPKMIREFSEESGGLFYHVGFLSDHKRIIVYRLSW